LGEFLPNGATELRNSIKEKSPAHTARLFDIDDER